MYSASSAFHKAVADGKQQMAMLIFEDAVFTNEDINVTSGIRFNDYFSTDDDIAIGQTPSNEITFSLFNDGRYLNNYEFGEFTATLGVLISEGTYQQTGSVYMRTTNASWTGNDVAPFVLRNGSAAGIAQPSFAVRSMLCYDGKVWAFSSSGQRVVYDERTGANITSQNPQLNAFMKNKVKGWNGKGIFYNKSARKLKIWEAGETQQYEFVPLGVFTAERPNAPDTIQLDLDCFDHMQKFEEDMPDKSTLGITYPVTLATLLQKLCDYVGVTLKTTTFINSTAKITSEPRDFESATMRDVLKWIAEAAAGNARFDRDGKLVIDWTRSTTQRYTETEYASFAPYWYETKQITKLYNRSSDGTSEKTKGSGDEGYLIQDNPILKGVS